MNEQNDIIIYGDLFDPDGEDNAISWTNCLNGDINDHNVVILEPTPESTIVISEDGKNFAYFSNNFFFYKGSKSYFNTVFNFVNIEGSLNSDKLFFKFSFVTDGEKYTLTLQFNTFNYLTIPKYGIEYVREDNIIKFFICTHEDKNKLFWNVYENSNSIVKYRNKDISIFGSKDLKDMWFCQDSVAIYIGNEDYIVDKSLLIPVMETNGDNYLYINSPDAENVFIRCIEEEV
jgi:hypothetical protein